MDTVSLPRVELTVKIPGGAYMFGTNLNQVNKPEIAESVSRFKKMLLQVEPCFSEDSDQAMIDLVNRLRMDGANSLKKDELVKLVISLGSRIRNILNVAYAVSPAYIEVWKQLIIRSQVEFAEITKILGFRPYVHIQSTWRPMSVYDIMLAPACCNVIRESYWDDKKFKVEFWLPQYMRKVAATAIMGQDGLKPKTYKALPDEDGLLVESFEEDMPRTFAFLNSLDRATPLLAGGTSAISLTKVKSAAKKMPSNEFAVNDPDFPQSRNQFVTMCFMTQLYFNETSRTRQPAPSLKTLAKFTVNEMAKYLPVGTYQMMMPRLKGFSKKLSESSRANMIAAQVRALIDKAVDNWLDMSNFRLRYMCEDRLVNSNAAYTALFSPDSWMRANVHTDDKVKEYRDTSDLDLWEDVTWRFILSYLRLLEAAGILEIAYATDGTATDTDGIRYVRYTALGRYALGVDDNYKPKVDTEFADRFDVDSDNMIITILNENSPYRTLFAQISDCIGHQRYKFSAAALVRDIRDKNDVSERIQSLRDSICPEGEGEWKILTDKTGPWADMFAEAELRANSRLPISGRYSMIKLNPEVPGLLDFILNTPEIASETIKAEQSILLIPDSFLDRFHKLANAAGYYL